MKKHWLLLADRFDALRPRERLMVFLGLVALLTLVLYLLVLGPSFQRYQQAKSDIARNETLRVALEEQERVLLQASFEDPDAGVRRNIQTLLEENEGLRKDLAGAQIRLAPPEKMAAILQDLIDSQKSLELVSLRSGKVEDLLQSGEKQKPEAGSSVPESNEQGIFRHGLELTVRGDYASLAAYVRRVEELPWKVYPSSLTLKVERYPVSTLSLTLYTLSLERAWLGF